jgi:hypothetical protein
MERNIVKLFDQKDFWLLAIFVFLKAFFTFFPVDYGLFRDEFYYLAMSSHVGLGYVDVPPLSAFLLFPVRLLLGDSTVALHLLPALSGSLFVVVAGAIVKRLGGGRFAFVLTLCAVTFAPQFIAFDTIYTYDTFDKLFWILVGYFFVTLLETKEKQYWLFLGIAAGLGLLTKITMLYPVFVLLTGLLLTQHRKLVFDWRFPAAGGLALLLFTPYLIWEVQHNWITLEYLANYARYKTYRAGPLEYLSNWILVLNPLSFPVWLAGIWYFLFDKEGKRFRPLGLGFLFLIGFTFIQYLKFYLITPYFALLLAGGSVMFEKWLTKKRLVWLKGLTPGLVMFAGFAILPLARPVLPIERFIEYARVLGMGKVKTENHRESVLPQFFADRFGWQEMTEKIATVFFKLSEEERKKAVILTGNYGEAGAISFYGKGLGLPAAISGHNQYHVWGPQGATGEIMIIIGMGEKSSLEGFFETVEWADQTAAPLAMPYEDKAAIFLCRGLKIPMEQAWSRLKHLN